MVWLLLHCDTVIALGLFFFPPISQLFLLFQKTCQAEGKIQRPSEECQKRGPTRVKSHEIQPKSKTIKYWLYLIVYRINKKKNICMIFFFLFLAAFFLFIYLFIYLLTHVWM